MNNVFVVSHRVFEDAEFIALSHTVKMLYVYLSKLSNRYANKEGWFWVSNKTLAKEAHMNIKTVVIAKKTLQDTGFLKYKVSTFNSSSLKATIYKLNHHMDIGKH